MGTNVNGANGTLDPLVWYYRLREGIARWDLTPLQIMGVYLVFGFLALYVSDVLLVQRIEEPARLSQLQAAKGGAEVVVTAGLLYGLARRSRRSLRATNERLARQREELQVLHRVLRHNLRNDMNVVQGYATSLAHAVEDTKHREWCEEIVACAERIGHYADQTRKINKVTEGDRLVTVDLVDAARRVIDESEEVPGAATVELSAPDSAPVRADAMIEAALDELLTNAIEHHEGDQPKIMVRIDPRGGPPHRTVLVMGDNGPGIPPQVRRTLEQQGETQLYHLDGLGLWFVSWAVTMSDGALTIEPGATRGTDVRIQLPKASSGPSAWPWVSPRTAVTPWA